MSIKRYLFMLFGALIILLGVSQLLISQYYKAQLQNELSESSRTLSQNLVKVLIDNVDSERQFFVEFDDQNVQEKLSGIEEVRADFERDIEEVSAEITRLSEEMVRQETQEPTNDQQQERKISALLQAKQQELRAYLEEMATHEREIQHLQRANIAEAKREAANAYKERLHQAVSQIQIDANSWLEKGKVAIIETPNINADGEMSFEFTHDIEVPSVDTNNQLERFSESMFVLILLSSIGGLLLAYILSHVISSPLSQLAKGHKKLGEGELGYQVEEQGVKELKTIIGGFNKMSSQLKSLSEQAHLMAQHKQLAELGEVTRGIAHSLRNPLHTVGLLSEAASHAGTKEEANPLLDQIQQKITMMDKSIQSLLTLSSNHVNRQTSVPLAAMIQDILLELSVNGSKPKITFECSADNSVILGAESEVRSIVHAVLINAVEATPDSGTINVGLDKKAEYYQIVVADTGKGIDADIRDKLAKPHVTTKAEGTGMGIYIAERLIEGHYGGKIEFNDNPGGGTVVTLTFAISKDIQSEAD
ncbi:two-component sensor histidine kinase [Shewanella mesophila]|uniref:sensor histidine kinase n=1 Tax=Shewanella mesophila TaxID=2864208 RepID=UPI001C65D40F|nr:HAMP domain-containing sensor histidine kinase [Shewanella mesophila]QYJ84801.1 two-component sensor histidine kinase [Shewanella mesophila]